jgi:hypothetical protein
MAVPTTLTSRMWDRREMQVWAPISTALIAVHNQDIKDPASQLSVGTDNLEVKQRKGDSILAGVLASPG